ncbi:GntR family transcriptional regulator [bacterium]|nr:GntR family transcriptional regulator [bacterium]
MADFADWTIDFSSGIPVYRQIVNLLFFEIGRGTLREGDRLPTIKELAERLKINPNTVAKAYRELDLKGIIAGRRGDGSFVAALTNGTVRLTRAQKTAKLDELFGRVVAEAKAYGITEREILDHVTERMHEDE